VADLEVEKLGRYEIVRELGRGAMGVVYEGFDPVVGRRVAVKTARRDVVENSTRSDELMERFLREARAAGALSHPNIVTVYDAGEENGVAYIAMEFLDGTDLQKLLEQNRKFPVERTLEITSTICAALAHAHANGVVHRDIKPANVVLLPNGVIKVADFGIARVSDSQLTQEGAVIGTPQYMSPEQFMGHAVDARSDLFSAGAIVYEMLTGERPFHGSSLSAIMHSVLNVTPVAPRALNFAVSECLSRVVMKALSKDMRARYQSADEMCRALKECLKDNPDPVVLQTESEAATIGLVETLPSNGGETHLMPLRSAPTQVVETPARVAMHIESAHDAGLLIRTQRLERGKSLEEIYRLTHVPERYLIALEEGDLSPFEDSEWSRVAECLHAFCEAVDVEPAAVLDVFELAYTETLGGHRRRMPRRGLLIGAALALLVLGGWTAYSPLAKWIWPEAELLAAGEKPSRDDYYQIFDLSFTIAAPQTTTADNVLPNLELQEMPADKVTATFSARSANGKVVTETRPLDYKGRLVVYDANLQNLEIVVRRSGYLESKQEPSLRSGDNLTLKNGGKPLVFQLYPDLGE
jgi:serine/threonine protein kinase